uniref:Reverse transcriptase domain-containing protein n=1 Tax=Sinocyclocheilus anshuiensis TaxID=1608454 RepID=A0A671RWG3_9TELE
IVKALYERTSSAVLLNNQILDFFPTTVGVRQGCILSPILFNLFLEQIMLETLAQDRDQWRALSATSSLMSPRRPYRLRD